MDVVYACVSVVLLGMLIVLGLKNDSLKKRIQEIEISLSISDEKYKNLEEKHHRVCDEWDKKQRKRILRDIYLVSEPPHKDCSDVVDAVIKYSSDCFLSAKSTHDIEAELANVHQSATYELYLNTTIRPLLNEREFLMYRGLLDYAKDSVLTHIDLDPHDILSQVRFFDKRGWTKNEGVLLEIIKDYYGSAMVQFTDNVSEFNYLNSEEVERILPLYIEKFHLSISDGGIEEVIHGHEASYRRSPEGLAKLFSYALFESNRVRPPLSVLDDKRFYTTIRSFFFGLVAYDINEYELYLDRIISNVQSRKRA